MLIAIVTWSAAALIVFCVTFFILCGCILLLDTIHFITMRERARTQISRIFFGTILAGLAAGVMVLMSPETLAQALEQAQTERTRAVVAEAQTSGVIAEVRELARAEQVFVRMSDLHGSAEQVSDSVSTLSARDEDALAAARERLSASAGSASHSGSNPAPNSAPNPVLAPNPAQSVVFIHTFEDTRAGEARTMSDLLEGTGYLAPGIDGLPIQVREDQVRYFHPQSREDAQAVAEVVGIETVRFVDGYQQRVGTDHLEIWLAP